MAGFFTSVLVSVGFSRPFGVNGWRGNGFIFGGENAMAEESDEDDAAAEDGSGAGEFRPQ